MGFLQKWAKRIRKRAATHGYVCDSCGAEVFEYPSRRLCAVCEGKMRPNTAKTCEKCGRQTVTEGVCLLCKQKLPAFTGGFSPFVYRGLSAALVNRIKNGKRRLAYYFAEKMAEYWIEKYPNVERFTIPMSALNAESDEKTDAETLLILPVPMTEKGVKERGFNQASELAEILVEALQEKGYAAELDVQTLQKRKETSPQKKMSFFERAEISPVHITCINARCARIGRFCSWTIL